MLDSKANFPMVCKANSMLFPYISLAQVWKVAKMVKFLESNISISITILLGSGDWEFSGLLPLCYPYFEVTP